MFSVKTGNRFQLITIIYFILGNLAFSFFVALRGGEIGIIPSIAVSQILFVGGAVLAYSLFTKVDFHRDFFIHKLNLVDALICIGIAWTIMPILSFINVLSQFFVTNQIQDALAQMMSLPYLVTLLMTALSPAVFEELLSRGIVLRNYQNKPVLTTCLISGMFFGFIHLNINQFLYAFVMGAVMAYVVMITNSILSSMIIHFTINATGTTLLYIISWMTSMLDDSGELFDQMMSTAAPTAAQLFISLGTVFLVALFFSPVAGLLVAQLLKRHKKTFKGSLSMKTEDFMSSDVKTAPSYKTSEEEVVLSPLYQEKGERVFTGSLILASVFFVLFALTLEFLMK